MDSGISQLEVSNQLNYEELDFITQEAPAKIKPMSLADLKLPYVVRRRVITAPGIWNGFYLSADTIKKAFENTDWNNKEVRSLYADHKDKDTAMWVGEIRNPEFDPETGCIIADLYFVDPSMAFKIAYGAKFGISPSLDAVHDNRVIKDFKFRNFAVVVQPAMLKNYINNALMSKQEGGEKMEKDAITLLTEKVEALTNELTALKSQFMQEFDVTEDELVEFASMPKFAEFVKKMKQKYPKMTLKEIAKLWKKQKEKYPEAATEEEGGDAEDMKRKKKKKEEYPYPYKYPYKYKYPKASRDFQSEEENKEEENQPEEQQEPAPQPEEPRQQEQPQEQQESKEEEPKEQPETKEEKQDVVNDYEKKIQLLQEKLEELTAKLEKPVRESSVSGNAPAQQEVKDPLDVFAEYIEQLRQGG